MPGVVWPGRRLLPDHAQPGSGLQTDDRAGSVWYTQASHTSAGLLDGKSSLSPSRQTADEALLVGSSVPEALRLPYALEPTSPASYLDRERRRARQEGGVGGPGAVLRDDTGFFLTMR